MPKAKQYDMSGKMLGEVDLPAEPFGIEPNQHVVWESVNVQLANRRQGTASTKTRALVRGGGKKPWRQKGTGRARAGSNRSPIWTGGGTVFGPLPRKYTKKVPVQIKRLALASALSQRAQEGNVAVLENFGLSEPKTKSVVGFLKAAGMEGRKVCFVTATSDETARKSCRNIPGVEILTQTSLNVYDLVNAEILIFTSEAVDGVKEAFSS